MSIRSNVSIRKKIIVYIFLFLILFTGIALVSMYFLSRSKQSEDLSKNALRMKSMVQNLIIFENQILTQDIVDESFYENHTSENLENFRSEYEQMILEINDIFQKDNLLVLDSTTIYDLSQRIENYKLSVDTLINKLWEKGFKDFGIIGEFRSSVHQAEDYLSAAESEILRNYMLTMRRHEKDFLLRMDFKYVNNFRNTYDSFMMELQNNPNPIFVEELTSLIDNYAQQFYQLVNLQMEISASNNGLQERVNTNALEIIPVLNHIIQVTDKHRSNMLLNMKISLMALLILTAFLVTFLLLRLLFDITKPINLLVHRISILSKGVISEKQVEITGNKEIVSMVNALNNLIMGLRKSADFANDISNEKYDTDFKPLSDKDQLGKSLLEMRENLLQAAEESEKQRQIENKQNWINSGSAKFADILNQNYSDTSEFAFNIISNLVKYLDANQGGMFLINDDNPNDVYLELKSAFAYNRRKFLEKRIEIGEGFVGTCVLEKSIIYRTEIPQDYLTITSGLGDANPKVLLIVPLVLDKNYYGAMEIASFHEIKDYELEFIRKISETIASTISAVKSKERTEKLLETTREQAEQITQTEEEMRQNMEELQATQEEMARKQGELEKRKLLMENLLDTIPLPIFVKDEKKRYYLVNKEEIALFKMPKDKIIGKTEEDLVQDKSSVHTANVSDDKVLTEKTKVDLPEQKIKLNNGIEKIFKTIKVPFTNNITNSTNLLGISLEITDNQCEKQLTEALEKIDDLTQQLNNLTSNT